MNEATERGLNKNLSFKSKRFVTVRENSDSIYLNEQELKALENLNLSNNKRLEKVRDLFLIGCYTGLRYSDYSRITSEHLKGDFIEITQTKTGDRVVIPIHPTIKGILKKYNGQLPKSYSNQKTNQSLKEIGKQLPELQKTVLISYTKGGLTVNENFAKWQLLTTHTARRSFATNEYLAGTPTLTIISTTGHRSEKSFLKYIKLSSKDHAKILKQQWIERNNLKAV
jgi:integrase